MARKIFILLICCGVVLNLKAQLSADFNSTVTSGCSPLVVNFTDNSTGGPTSWSWSFGNGNNSFQQNPSAAYLNPGIYDVTMIISDGVNYDTILKPNYIQVYQDPAPDFTSDVQTGCVPLTVNFTNTTTPGDHPSISYTWDFGDGTFSNALNPTHTFNSTGVYNVILIGVDGNTCQNDIVKTGYITVANGPNANFSSINGVGCSPPHTVNFSNSSSGASALTYQWDFGDGNSSTQQNPANSYIAYGSYNVKLVVLDIFGCKDSITKSSEVNIINVNAGFTQSSVEGCLGDPFVFTDLSTPAGINPTGWVWNFGDGDISTLQNTTHSYNAPGVYTVSLTTTMNGCQDVRTKNNLITIHGDPVANFSSSLVGTCQLPVTIDFTDNSVNAVSHVYYFGDGDTSHRSSPTHVYNNYGTYTVSLVVTNNEGCTDTFSTFPPISIQRPQALFNVDQTEGCLPVTVTFNDSSVSSEAIASWWWDFGDGSTDSVQDPSHTYTVQGDYSVTLIIETLTGCRDTLTIPNLMEVGAVPNVNFTASPTNTCLYVSTNFTNLTDISDMWQWDFGDGGVLNTENPSYTYSDTGYFDVTLTVSNNGCIADTTFQNYVYVSPPDALFNITYDCINTFGVDFTNTSIGGDVWWWAIDTGGLVPDTVFSYDATYIFPDTGTYDVELYMEDTASGCVDVEIQTVTIVNPIPDFTMNQSAGCRPLIINFTSTSNDAVSYIWSFSNGQNASSPTPTIIFAQPNYYDVHLLIYDIHGCERELDLDSIIVVSGPTSNFTASNPVGCTPFTVDFTDLTTLFLSTSITSWSWDFGDGNTSTLQNPSNTYMSDGIYNVRLTTVDDLGCTHTHTKTNYISSSQPVADFTADTLSCPGNPVDFYNLSTGLSNSYQWDFGDGNGSILSNPFNNYQFEGTYDIELIATDINNCADTLLKQLYVQVELPRAKFTSDTAFTTCPPLFANFIDSSSGDIIRWEWHFGDGSMSNLQNPSHIYTYADSFDVTLIVMSSDSCLDTTLIEDYAVVLGPNGTFTMAPTKGCTDLPVDFMAETKNADIRTWDFGDGSVITGPDTVTYTYTSSGLYNPSLILTDVFGCVFTVTTSDSIIAGNHNVAFVENPRHICIPNTVNFTDISTAFPSITNWKWYFGDGDSSLLQNPAHMYTTQGNYDITLITDNGICKDTLVKPRWIDADPGPSAEFTMSSSAGCVPHNVQFFDATTSDSLLNVWSWSFDDGNISSLQNPNHTFTIPGTYTVRLIVLTVAGCFDTVTHTVTAYNNPNVNTSPDRIICEGDSVLIFATGGSIYNWTPGNTLTDSTDNFPRAFPTTTTKYIIQVSNGFGCNTYDSVTVTVNPLPFAFAGPDHVICNLDTVLLTGVGGGTPSWSPSLSLSNTNIMNPYAFPGTTTDYILSISDGNGCTSRDSVNVFVNQLPNVSAGVDTFVCDGTSANLSASGALFYNWSPSTYLSSTVIPNPVSTPASSITYYLVGIDSNGCQSSDSIAVQYVVRPSANAGVDRTICEGDTAFLLAVGGDASSTILWSPDTMISSITTRNTGVLPVTSMYYSVVITDTYGCADSDSVFIFVNPKPPISVSPDTSICLKDSVQIAVTGGLSYSWLNYYTTCPSCPVTYVKPDITTNYTVSITDINTCTNTDTVTIVVHSLPVGIFSNDTVLCNGETTVLKADTGVSYTWAPSASLSCSDCQEPTVYTSTSQLYIVVIDNEFGCVMRDSVQVDVVPVPIPVITGNSVICQGDTAQLAVSGGDSYYWTPNFAIDCQTCDSIIAFPQVDVNYIVEVRNTYGCRVYDSIEVFVRPFPVIDAGPDRTICKGESVQMQATSNVSNNIWKPSIWLSNPSSLTGSATPIDTTMFVITATSLANCTSRDTMFINVLDKVRINVSPDTILCFGDSIQIHARPVATSDNGIDYVWRPGFYLDNPTLAHPTTGALQDITYMVIASSATCAPDTQYINVDVKDLPTIDAGSDIVAVAGSDVVLQPTQGVDYVYQWYPPDDLSCSDCSNPVFPADSSTTFMVIVSDKYGCLESDTIEVEVIGVCNEDMLFVANAFTPNGDGKNDLARVRSRGIKQIDYFRIYDRWGKLVFETYDMEEGWNGRINGKPASPNVFVYYVSTTCPGNESIVKTGNITLIR